MYAPIRKRPTGDYRHPQTITYWRAGNLDMFGQPTWSGPHVVPARIEEGNRVYYIENGREVRGRAYVFLPQQLLKVGDKVLFEKSDQATPPQGTFEVKQERIIPSLLGTAKEYRFAM